jgi:acyl-coenzyme A thioesterase PaaI-like protein
MPLIDFSSHDPDFSQQQVNQCARIVAGLRKINEKIVRLSAPLDVLTAAADQVEALLESLDAVTQQRAMETFRYEFNRNAPNGAMPFNPATGEFNPVAPPMQTELDGKKLIAHLEFPNCYESAPDSVQGGMVAAVFDQLLAFAMMAEGATGPTLWLNVKYLKPTPIKQPLRFECEVDSIDGKKFAVKGSCHHGDVKVSEAEALILKVMEMPVVGS